MVQLNYRYATPEYIQTALNTKTVPAFQDGISQVGITGSWPIADRWAVVGAYYYDTRAKQSADQLVGLKYNTCCWAVTRAMSARSPTGTTATIPAFTTTEFRSTSNCAA